MPYRRFVLSTLLFFLLSACAREAPGVPTVTSAPPTITPSATPTDTPTPPPTDTPTPPPTTPVPVEITPTPGLLISGYVQSRDGTGLAGVTICRSFASYNGVVVATTDATGFFRSDFTYIPGDEMVSVWALAPGYDFDPPSYSWRHYYGLEERPLDFMALPATTTATPPVPCP